MELTALLQQTLDLSQDAILVADQQGIIRYWNAGAERIQIGRAHV
mgnify:CR=1 FL=1